MPPGGEEDHVFCVRWRVKVTAVNSFQDLEGSEAEPDTILRNAVAGPNYAATRT